MSQPPVSGHVPGGDPAGDSRLPGGSPATPGQDRERELRLGDFTQGGAGDTCPPGPGLTAAIDSLSGAGWRCDGATDDELIGLLGRWAAAESWAAAGKLGVVRELIRRRAVGSSGTEAPGGLPGQWDEGTGHELAAALRISLPAADKMIDLAWTLGARLPRIGAKLADGTIDCLRAKIIADETSVLNDEQAARAEALIIDQLAGKTPGQIGKLTARAVVTVDPEGARKRREQAEREDARIRFWRENTGASALAAYGLPTDAALSANANIHRRAEQYKEAKVSPGARMDQLRVLAFLDILNDVSAAARIAQAGPDNAGASHPGASNADDAGAEPALPARSNLTLPLAALLGLAERPGEGLGLGPLDPALVRDLAATAARSRHSEWCVTVTDPHGYAIAHGCARPARATARVRARVRASPSARNRDGPWRFTRRDDTGPQDPFGPWALTLPDGRELTVQLSPIPVTDCDHRYESRSYQPSATLRHLVEIRDGTCTFPPCSRPARACDFEHATPYDQGGRTCACNAGTRSRRCHKVKQSKGWSVSQPRPGWHQWTTPSGRTYTNGPMEHPA